MKPQANSRRPEKLSAIQEIDSIIANSDYCFVLNYGGLTVASLADLRARLAKSQSALKVVKNTYLAKALETKGWTGLEAVLNGPTALVTGSGDPAEVAKSLMEFLQKDQDLVKKLYRADREDPILFFASGYSEGIPLTVDNLVLVCNELQLGRKDLEERTPMLIRERAGQWKEKKKEKQEKNPENVQKVVDTGFYL